jgi:RNA polymerase sigma-70 factor (ECF subfamily)
VAARLVELGREEEDAMSETPEAAVYTDFLRRLRAGDERAAEEMVRRYEAEIRTEIRVWLRMRDPRLRRVFDSMDICQSVMASFFVRAAVGDFDLDEPRQLIALLVGMARNKLSEHVKHHQRQRRDVRRVAGAEAEANLAPGRGETPSMVATYRELLQMFRDQLTEEERQVADLRAEGRDWAAVAAALGGTPEGRRKQLTRAVERVSKGLGLDTVAR